MKSSKSPRLVLSRMDSYDSESRRIFQHFSRSTRFTRFCTAQISKFEQKVVRDFGQNEVNFISFRQKISEFCHFSVNFMKFCQNFAKNLRKLPKFWIFLENCEKKMREISGIGAKFYPFTSFLQSCPY